VIEADDLGASGFHPLHKAGIAEEIETLIQVIDVELIETIAADGSVYPTGKQQITQKEKNRFRGRIGSPHRGISRAILSPQHLRRAAIDQALDSFHPAGIGHKGEIQADVFREVRRGGEKSDIAAFVSPGAMTALKKVQHAGNVLRAYV